MTKPDLFVTPGYGERQLKAFHSQAGRSQRLVESRMGAESRTHLSLKKDAPIPRDAQTAGRVLALPVLGGLRHRYVRI
jgi:hypothetical protein